MTPGDRPRAVFFGTPEWAVPSLDALVLGDVEVAAVVTNPDRPAGRGYEVKASPVKERAVELGLPVLQPESARGPELAAWLSDQAPDVAVVVAYGKILPADLLAIPRSGFVNMHFSLLPKFRGAAPVQRAVMEGVPTAGASIMVLTEGMDEGPVLCTQAVSIGPTETSGELGGRLAELGASLLAEALPRYLSGDLLPVPQDHAAATYAPKISPEEARIDWLEAPQRIFDKVRGLHPFPGAWTTLRDQRLKVHSLLHPEPPIEDLLPGELRAVGEALLVGTGGAALALGEIQLAGKKRTTGAGFARGIRLTPGERLGDDTPPAH